MGQTPVPKINDSEFQDILKEAHDLAPFYTPEWSAVDEKSPDNALLKLFAHMLETSIRRLNRVPEKNFIAFLDMLGIKLVPPQPARAPLTFLLSKGATENMLIPERTQAAAGEIIFETETNILATPAKLICAYTNDINQDEIYQAQPNIISGETVPGFSTRLTYDARIGDKDLFLKDVSSLEEGDILEIGVDSSMFFKTQLPEYVMISEVADTMVTLTARLDHNHSAENTTVSKVTVFELFGGRNIQEHVLYLGHKDLFNIKPAKNFESSITLNFTLKGTAEQTPVLEWSHWGKKEGAEAEEWLTVDSKEDIPDGLPDSKTITLTITDEIKETEINGIKNKWLRARVKGPLQREKTLPVIDQISVDMGNTLVPDAAYHNDIPSDLTIENGLFQQELYPFGKKPHLLDTFYLASKEAFSKKEVTIYLNFDVPASGSAIPVQNIHGIGPTFTALLNREGIYTSDQLLQRSETELMDILNTKMRNRVKNILSAARKAFIEASQLDEMGVSAAGDNGDDDSDDEKDNLALSWEYWNGKGWTVLNNVSDGTDKLRSKGIVSFPCPPDIEASQVNGQESYWIRVRIASGDYGKEETTYQSDTGKIIINEANIIPPVFSMVTINYSLNREFMEYCLTCNNLEYIDFTEESKIPGKTFRPFQTMDDEHKTLYLAFDKKLESGPLSVFFAIQEPQYVAETSPRIVWEYYAQGEEGGEWLRLQVLDKTKALSRSGTIQFVVPDDFIPCSRFGRELYWIRAVDTENRFQSPLQVYADVLKVTRPSFMPQPAISMNLTGSVPTMKAGREEALEECPSSNLVAFHPLWAAPAVTSEFSPNPVIEGIYLNTTWALQMEVIKDEILGSSDGETGQSFTLTRVPVVSDELWVNEFNALSEDEINDIIDKAKMTVKAVKDDKGNMTEFWIKWTAVDELLSSAGDDRHYEIDRISGTVTFGDDTHGMIPPVGTDNIKADYRVGGGKSGNVENSKISNLKTSVAFVDKVYNPVAAAGGSETEEIENVLERGPQVIRHRNRAVTREDFEWLARQASHRIARVKCLPNFDNKGEHRAGWVTVIIVPESEEKQPTPTLELKSQAETYLKDCTANTVVSPEHLQISQPVYVEASVDAVIVTTSIDAIPEIESKAFSLLDEFLHPLTGGFEGEGWDFGKAPCLSDFFALLENIQDVDHVPELKITFKAGQSERSISPDEPGEIEMPPYTLICSGEHGIKVRFEKEVWSAFTGTES